MQYIAPRAGGPCLNDPTSRLGTTQRMRDITNPGDSVVQGPQLKAWVHNTPNRPRQEKVSIRGKDGMNICTELVPVCLTVLPSKPYR